MIRNEIPSAQTPSDEASGQEVNTASGVAETFDLTACVVLRSGFTAGDEFFMGAMRGRGVTTDVSLRPLAWRPLRAVRRAHLLSRLPGKSIWFGTWSRSRVSKNLVVVHAADLTLPAARHALRCFPGARIVFWFWNPAGKGTNPSRASGSAVELWSFDPDDCRRFGMRHNTQFQFQEIGQLGARVSPDVDLGFFGSDKGRAEHLSALAEQAESLGLTHRFSVVADGSSDLTLHPYLRPASTLPYAAMLEETARARAVVDIAQAGQSGMTLRTLEALYLGRKLVTNITSVRNSPLYHSSRVHILGQDDVANLPAFLASETPAASAELLRYYDFEAWLRRFW